MSTHSDIAPDTLRKIAILCVIAKNPLISSSELSRLTEIPYSSLHRHIQQLRRAFFVDIIFIHSTDSGVRGRIGGYEIRDWGIIDKDELLRRYGYLVAQNDPHGTGGDNASEDGQSQKGTAAQATKAKKRTSTKRVQAQASYQALATIPVKNV